MRPGPLTAMEHAVLQRVALGDTYQQAGRRLCLTESAARNAGWRAVHRLEARNITHAAVLALTAGLVHPYPCGDVRTYRWHLRRGERPDPACLRAEADYQRDWRARKAPEPSNEGILISSDRMDVR